jgi:signal transduction histidine kinase
MADPESSQPIDDSLRALAAVAVITRAMAGSLSRDELAVRLARATARELDAHVALMLRDATGGLVTIAAAGPDDKAPAADDLAPLLAECAASLARGEAASGERPAGSAVRSWLAIPLTIRGGSNGALVIASARPDGLGALGRRIAEELAPRIASALEQSLAFEELSRLDATKNDFLAFASHELRTPLSTILGWSKLLADDPSPQIDRVKKGLEVIQRNAQAQAQLVDDILDTSRILRNKIQISKTSAPVATAMEQAIEQVRASAAARSVTIVTDLDASAAAPIDVARLKQIFVTLLSNAIKFSSQGGVVRVAVRAAGDEIVATVADEGAGIESDLLPHIFDRLRLPPTKKHGGHGLGLALADRLASMQDVTIQAASDGAGRGATFRVIIRQS